MSEVQLAQGEKPKIKFVPPPSAKSELFYKGEIEDSGIEEKDLSGEALKAFQFIKIARQKGLVAAYNGQGAFQIYYKDKRYLVSDAISNEGSKEEIVLRLAKELKVHLEKPPIIVSPLDPKAEVSIRTIDCRSKFYDKILEAEKLGFKLYFVGKDGGNKIYQLNRVVAEKGKTKELEVVKEITIDPIEALNQDLQSYRNQCFAGAISIAMNAMRSKDQPALPPVVERNQSSRAIDFFRNFPVSHTRIVLNENEFPQLSQLGKDLAIRGYEIWFKTVGQDELSIGIVDKGDKTLSVGNTFLEKVIKIKSSDRVVEGELVQKIESILKQDPEYLRRSELMANIGRISKAKDIHKLVVDSLSPSACNLRMGDELRYGVALYFILESSLEKGKYDPALLYDLKMPLLHNLQRIHNYDNNFLSRLNPGELREFCVELVNTLAAEKIKLLNERVIDSETKLIAIIGDDEKGTFDPEFFKKEIERRFKITQEQVKLFIAKIGQPKENKEQIEEFLKEVRLGAFDPKQQNTVVWTWMHGNSDGLGLTFSDSKKEYTELPLQKLIASIGGGKNEARNPNLRFIFDQCFSFDFSRNFVKEVVKVFRDDEVLPLCISTSSRGNVTWSRGNAKGGRHGTIPYLISEYVSLAQDRLSVKDFFRLDYFNEMSRGTFKYPVYDWSYSIVKEDGTKQHKSISAGEKYAFTEDIAIFARKPIETSVIIDDTLAKLKARGIEIAGPKGKVRSDNLPLEISDGSRDNKN